MGGFARCVALLGDGRDRRNQPGQTFGDDSVGGVIRLRHRRPVLLAVDPHGQAIDGENGCAGPNHQIGQWLHQRGRGIAIDLGSGQICLIDGRFHGRFLRRSISGVHLQVHSRACLIEVLL